MGKRVYNILLHTHTISGIIISAALYVIFFAGSFSFFRDEIANWQNSNHPVSYNEIPNNLDRILVELKKDHTLDSRNVDISHSYNEGKVSINLSAVQDTTLTKENRDGAFFYLNTQDFSSKTYMESYGLGEFLYRLHFFDPIPYPYGRHLSGFIALFFLFAVVTGILIHWKKIVSNFYMFRPWAKIKAIWTDAHTALGVIGFPFQFVYALTGAYFFLQTIVFLPYLKTLYEDDLNALYEDLGSVQYQFEYTNVPLKKTVKLDFLIAELKNDWEDFKLTDIRIFNYGNENMHVYLGGHLNYGTKFNGEGHRIYKISDHSIVDEVNPFTSSDYNAGVRNVLLRLHLGDYAGLGLRLVSFVLGLISCFVIISGVLIWSVARERKDVPERKRKFNFHLTNIYLAVCLGMYPVTALLFVLVRVFNTVDRPFIYKAYFYSWLAVSIFFIVKRNLVFTNKWSLISGGVLGLMVPIVNGLVSKIWFWQAYGQGYTELVVIDVLWLFLGGISLWVALFKLNTSVKKGEVATT